MFLSRGEGRRADIYQIGRRIYTWKGLSLASAIILATLAFLPAAMTSPISFDGGMNLQVAQNLADHGQYARHYTFRDRDDAQQIKDNVRPFPSEVQTNGPFTLVAALGIKLFGHGQFAYQFANLFFIGTIAAAIWWILRRSLIIAALAPVFILLSLKFTLQLSLAGYGDIAAIFFIFLAFIFLAKSAAVDDKIQAPRYVGISLLFFGAACITKTYLIGAMPALILGLIVAHKLNKKNLTVGSLKPRLLYVLVVPVLYELGRLLSYGSFVMYFRYWRHEVRVVLQQTGLMHYAQQPTAVKSTHAKVGVLEKLDKHTDSLFQYVHNLGLLLLLTVAAVALLWWVLRVYSRSPSQPKLLNKLLKSETAKEYVVMLTALVTMAFSYFAWWISLLPTQKEFVRRSYPGTIPFEVALILVGIILAKLYLLRSKQITAPRINWGLRCLAALYIVTLCFMLVSVGTKSWKWTDSGSFVGLKSWENTASFVQRMPKGATLYGVKWQSAPIVSLMANRDFRNLDSANFCALNPAKDFVIWDAIASHNRTTPVPPGYDQAVTFTVYKVTPAAVIYRVSPNTDSCKLHP
jgi:hypothetical protein